MTRMNHNRCLAFLAAGMIVLAFLGCRGDGSAVVSGGTADGQAAGLSARRPLADFDGRIVGTKRPWDRRLGVLPRAFEAASSGIRLSCPAASTDLTR